MLKMFLICGGLATIPVIVYLCSVYLARWAIRVDFGQMLASVLSEPDDSIIDEFAKMTKEQIAQSVAQNHFDMRIAIQKKQFALVEKLNRKVYFAMSIMHDILVKDLKKNENSTSI